MVSPSCGSTRTVRRASRASCRRRSNTIGSILPSGPTVTCRVSTRAGWVVAPGVPSSNWTLSLRPVEPLGAQVGDHLERVFHEHVRRRLDGGHGQVARRRRVAHADGHNGDLFASSVPGHDLGGLAMIEPPVGHNDHAGDRRTPCDSIAWRTARPMSVAGPSAACGMRKAE